MLERVHQLVRDDDPGLRGIDVRRDVQGARVRVVVARDLLGEEVDHRTPQIDRVGEQPEQLIRRLHAGELRGGQVLVELVNHVVSHLRPGAPQHQGMVPEPEPGGTLDRRRHLLDRLLQFRFALHLARAAGARGRCQERHDHPARSQPVHSIPFPTAAPTARAMSCPPTTIP